MPASAPSDSPDACTVTGVRLAFGVRPEQTSPVLDIDALTIPGGARMAITGPSGSGKTTLLHVLAGIETPQRGSVTWGDTDLVRLGENARDRWRRDRIGMVFQDFHLLPGMSALDNVTVTAHFGGRRDTAVRQRAHDMLIRIGVPDPNQGIDTLSRGEMQRVAVARAVLFRPRVLLADEPTASLDDVNAAAVADLLVSLARENGATLVAATHDARLISRLDSVVRLEHGRLVTREKVAA